MQKFLIFFFTTFLSCIQANEPTPSHESIASESMYVETILEATIELFPAQSEKTPTILPGSLLNLKALVKNSGTKKSTPGSLFIHFVLPSPLDKEKKSLLFKTEILELPSLAPQETVIISFKTPQQLPNVQNFIRNDWPMHQYQAILISGERTFLIGTRTLTFSAHYYQGPAHELPTKIN